MTALLQARGITKDFAGLRALSDVDLEVEQGTVLGIIGPNGAGKSTLFNIIAGDESPTHGSLEFDGQALARHTPDQICRMGIARTYQSVRPFLGLSVQNNVRVALLHGRRAHLPRAEVDDAIRAELEFVGLNDLAERRAETLIPLHRKRLELARALATQPRLLLLDELIAGLTPTETLTMMDTLRAVNARGITVLLIEHVMKAVMGLAHRLMVLHHGEKIAEGEPQEIARDPEVIRAYLGEGDPSH